ncbi:MAG: class II aldolase/adducin family protein, partial [Nocardioidaceae bacterium]|nr:class II aldolase/adducin family protein [Nocardioidaceae bacterium]
GDLIAATGTGVDLAHCAVSDVTLLDRAGTVSHGPAPTSELALHLGVYDDHPLAAAVVHTHAPYATAVACVLDELPVLHYQQLSLGGAIRVAPYATFGSAELAIHVRTALEGRLGALMANHGSISVGGSLNQAVENALLLEWLCQLHHRAAVLGTPRALTTEQQDDVVRAAIERNYGAST